MDKYDRHLNFLIKALPGIDAEVCTNVFLNDAKRDVRKALFFLLQPKEEKEDLMDSFPVTESAEEQVVLLNKILHCYCPNESFTKIVGLLSKGKPCKIDTATLPKLKNFRRVPRTDFLRKLFLLVQKSDPNVIVTLLTILRPFGRELEPFWATIDAYANFRNTDIAKAALNLLSKMPSGVQKSIMTFANHTANPEMCIPALSAMQHVYDLDSKMVINLFSPLINEYRRLMPSQGKMNDLWEEFRLLQRILKNNGVILSIPDIRSGFF